MTELLILGLLGVIAQVTTFFIIYKMAIKQHGRGLDLAASQFQQGLRHYRMSVTSRHFERFSRELYSVRENVDGWLDAPGSIPQKLGQLSDPHYAHIRGEIIVFANFFQELGMSFKAELTDREYVHEIFSFLVKKYWDQLHFWILAYREEKKRPSLFSEWHDLYLACEELDKNKNR